MSSKVRSIKRARDRAAARGAMIPVTLRELVDSREAMQRLVSQPMPGRESLKLWKIAKAVTVELDICEEMRFKLCENHNGVFDGIGTHVFADDADRQALEKDYAEMVSTEVSIPGELINEGVLADLQLSAADFAALAWLIKEEADGNNELGLSNEIHHDDPKRPDRL